MQVEGMIGSVPFCQRIAGVLARCKVNFSKEAGANGKVAVVEDGHSPANQDTAERLRLNARLGRFFRV